MTKTTAIATALILGTSLTAIERAPITLCIGAGMGTATVIERVN